MVDEKICCGTHIDKGFGEDLLLCRVGDELDIFVIKMNHVIPMEFTGRSMKG